MAERSDITTDHNWFTGTDHVFEFTIYQADGITPQDITGWTLSWMLKRAEGDADSAAILTKTGGAVNVVTPGSGRVDVTVADTDTVSIPGDSYFHELKRIDDQQESVESYGSAVLKQSLHRA